MLRHHHNQSSNIFEISRLERLFLKFLKYFTNLFVMLKKLVKKVTMFLYYWLELL